MSQWLAGCIAVVQAAPVRHFTLRSSQTLTTREPLPVCAFDGNADFYGLGIRIGIYLQWASALLANRYVPDATRGLLITNSIFLLAVCIAALQSTIAGTLQKAEALVLQHICFGFLFSVLTLWGTRVKKQIKTKVLFSLVDISFRLALSAAISAFGVWFWFVGNNILPKDGCTTVTFVLARIDTQSSVKHFYQAQSVLIAAVYGVLLLRNFSKWIVFAAKSLLSSLLPAGVLAIMDQLWNPNNFWGVRLAYRWLQMTPLRFWLAINHQSLRSADLDLPASVLDFPFCNGFIIITWASAQYLSLLIFKRPLYPRTPPLLRLAHFQGKVGDERQTTPFLSQSRKALQKVLWTDSLALVNFICFAWAIFATEFTLKWNKVSDINSVISTGQLIPLIIGIASFGQTTYTIVIHKTQIAVTDIIMRRLIDPPKEYQNLRPEPGLESYNTNLTWRFPLKGNYEAVFWRQGIRRRRSVDILMSGTDVPNARLGVADKDIVSMGLLKEPPSESKTRRNSISYISRPNWSTVDNEHQTALAESPNVTEPSLLSDTSETKTKRPRTFGESLLKSVLFAVDVCAFPIFWILIVVFKTIYKIIAKLAAIGRFRKAGEGLFKLIFVALHGKSNHADEAIQVWNNTEASESGIEILEEQIQHAQQDSSASSLSPSSIMNRRKILRRRNQIASIMQLIHKWMVDSTLDFDLRLSTSSSTTSSLSDIPRAIERRPSYGPKSGTGNWGPHITYTFPTMHALTIPSSIPLGPLHTIISSFSYASSRFMHYHPQMSATAASFADILAELGEIYSRRVKGQITGEEQDRLFQEWVDEFRREYVWGTAAMAIAWIKRREEFRGADGENGEAREDMNETSTEFGNVVMEAFEWGFEMEKRRRGEM